MANQANYAKIGFAVAVGAAAIVATLVYLGGALGKSDVIYAESYFDTQVSGLSVGSAVNLRGVKVGEVRAISFIGAEYDDAQGDDVQKIYEVRGTLRFLPQLEMRPSSNAPNPVECREAPPTSSFPDFSEPP